MGGRLSNGSPPSAGAIGDTGAAKAKYSPSSLGGGAMSSNAPEKTSSTIRPIQVQALKRTGQEVDAEEMAGMRDKVKASYEEKTDVRYAAARLWVDAIVQPEETRAVLITAMEVATRFDDGRVFKTGSF